MTRYCHTQVTATKPYDPESPQKIFFLRCQLQNLCKYNYLLLPSNGHETFNLPKRVLLHDSTTWLPRNYHKNIYQKFYSHYDFHETLLPRKNHKIMLFTKMPPVYVHDMVLKKRYCHVTATKLCDPWKCHQFTMWILRGLLPGYVSCMIYLTS